MSNIHESWIIASRCLIGSLFCVTFVESIDASGRIDKLLLSGEERMTSGTNLDVKIVFFGRSRFKSFPASACYRDFIVFGVNSRFHFTSSSFVLALYRQLNAATSKQVMIGAAIRIVKLLLIKAQ